MAANQSKAVVKADKSPVALQVSEALAADLIADGGTQQMEFKRDDVAQSFLKVAQALTPELQEDDAKYIPDLKQGDLFSNGSGKVWRGKDGVLFVPIHYQKSYLEWTLPKGVKSTIVNDFGDDDRCTEGLENVKGSWPRPDGRSEITLSAIYFGLLIDPEDGAVEQTVVSLGGTQYKKARRWNRAIQNAVAKHPVTGQSFKPAPFYFAYRITTTPESNDQGRWFGVVINQDAPVLSLKGGEDLYVLCRSLKDLIKTGAKKVQTVVEPDVEAVAEASARDEIPGQQKSAMPSVEAELTEEDDDLPF